MLARWLWADSPEVCGAEGQRERRARHKSCRFFKFEILSGMFLQHRGPSANVSCRIRYDLRLVGADTVSVHHFAHKGHVQTKPGHLGL